MVDSIRAGRLGLTDDGREGTYKSERDGSTVTIKMVTGDGKTSLLGVRVYEVRFSRTGRKETAEAPNETIATDEGEIAVNGDKMTLKAEGARPEVFRRQ